MAQSKRWRKAMIVSLVFHALILTSVGWVASRSLESTTPQEQVVELDLSQEDDLPGEQQQTVDPVTGKPMESTSQPAAASPATLSSNAPHVVAATSSMSVLSAEVSSGGEATASGSGGSSGGSSSGETMGSSGGNSSGGSGGSGAGNSGSGRGSSGYTHPGILSQVTPSYPDSARRQGIEGTVLLKIQILPSGRPGFVSVYRSSGNQSLDDAAVEAVEQWRFIPAEDRSTGEAITCVTTLPIVFRLN